MKHNLLNSLGFAIHGLRLAIFSERNLRIHLSITFLVLVVSAICKISTLELALIFIAISIVLVAELVNTAIEKTIDLFQVTYHPLAKAAKDIAAGAVLVAAFTSVIIGMLVFGPYLLRYIW